MKALIVALISMVFLGSALAKSSKPAESDWVSEDRARAMQFAKELRSRLQAALAVNPIEAIEVCQLEAPQIAQRWSTEQITVRRTGVRVRNEANAPSSHDEAMLERFAARLAAGELPAALEEFSAAQDGSRRYARALVMEPTCQLCHGEALAPSISAAIKARYPADRATGFRSGELRGAVVVETRAASADQAP